LFERISETGIGNFHALGVLDDGFAVGEEPGNGKRHGDAMITEARDASAA
jgi:hypothetical protein